MFRTTTDGVRTLAELVKRPHGSLSFTPDVLPSPLMLHSTGRPINLCR